MDELTRRQQAVLEVIDEQIAQLEKRLEKARPLIEDLERLKQTRRVLLSEKAMTGGRGSAGRAQLTQEEVITVMRDRPEGVTPAHITERLGVDGTIVRSHLNRHKDTTYKRNDDGLWVYIGEDSDEDE